MGALSIKVVLGGTVPDFHLQMWVYTKHVVMSSFTTRPVVRRRRGGGMRFLGISRQDFAEFAHSFSVRPVSHG